jgi:selenocysteine lyase/cysteine desulfurase
VNDRTVLVAVSEVSTINGFRHDLKAVAELAHAHGAKVYVDAVHATGATPVDVKATGVDLMASSSYKWLMGDMGLGFMYVREDLIGALERPQAGYQQLAAISSHVFPHDEPGERAYETRARDDAIGLFAMGTFSNTGVAHMDYSLDWLNTIGVETIQAWRQPMIERVRAEMSRLGFEPLSPEDSDSALIAFSIQDARERLGPRLRAAGVQAGLSQHRLRVSVGVFNDDGDIDRLLEALS